MNQGVGREATDLKCFNIGKDSMHSLGGKNVMYDSKILLLLKEMNHVERDECKHLIAVL